MNVEAGAIIATGLAIAASLFWAGWYVRGVKSEFKMLNLILKVMKAKTDHHDTSISDLYDKLEAYVTTAQCDRLRAACDHFNGEEP